LGCFWLSFHHAQSPRQVERCAELGRSPSDGESACPRKTQTSWKRRHRQGIVAGPARLAGYLLRAGFTVVWVRQET
jgi:hypothetical protein